MDRFFLVYRLNEAHRKAVLEKQKQAQPQQQKNTSESLIKKNEVIKQNDEAIRFENDFSEWVYKMVNF